MKRTTIVVLLLTGLLVSLGLARTTPTYAAVSLDPNFTASLLAAGLSGPANGLVYRPDTNDLLVSEFRANKVEVDVEIGSLGEEVPVVDHAESLKSVRHFCAMARQKMDKLTPDQARHFLRSLVEKMVFDWQRMEVRIIGHIPAMNASDILRRDSTGWAVRTWGENLGFELLVQL